MEWVATTSEQDVSSFTTADGAHFGCQQSTELTPTGRFKWTRPFHRKTKFGFCTCAITFQLACTTFSNKELCHYHVLQQRRSTATNFLKNGNVTWRDKWANISCCATVDILLSGCIPEFFKLTSFTLLKWNHLILVIIQLNAQILVLELVYYVPLHVSSTAVLITRRSKLYYTASGIITICRWPSGAQVERVLSQPVHRTATYSVTIPDAVLNNFDLLMMSTTVRETCRGM